MSTHKKLSEGQKSQSAGVEPKTTGLKLFKHQNGSAVDRCTTQLHDNSRFNKISSYGDLTSGSLDLFHVYGGFPSWPLHTLQTKT